MPILHKKLQENKMLGSFSIFVSACIDTLGVCKSVFDKSTVENYKQDTLVQKYLQKSYEAHNSLADVQSLEELYYSQLHGKYNQEDFVFVFGSHILRTSLKDLEQNKILSGQLCSKLSRSGIGSGHLSLAFQRDSVNGLKSLLSEPCGCSVRGTKNGKIILRLQEYFTANVNKDIPSW